ncbi:putative ABC transport system ATP-binding protein [Actinokineospora baliensis]|uniref:ABC transporter ATP-binding protein n=1 Tax=Actinokineospora baliensis TaxID=547056 RepID=UPI0019589A72|nr:ABC transporter ATP-binding protein [Actinokineospora baliensis]MBM7776034.1 putative ABC transport system ATP-binding protein [Actinokineospora baliensis]
MTSTTKATAVEAVQLWSARKVYGTGDHAVTALDDVSIGFLRGTFTAIMGPSGSGKSTLLQCAAGLDQPTSGKVVVAGTDIGALDETARTVLRRDHIGFVFQAFNLVGSLTAAQNVELPVRFAGKRAAPADVLAALAEVGLADRVHHRPGELSGGQQQRVALARALITRPDVLFADEPTGALDTTTSREVLRLLRGIVDRHAQTVIMVTHDPVAASYADRVVFLKDGRIADQLVLPPEHRNSHPAAIAGHMARLES